MNFRKGTFCQVPNIQHIHKLTGNAQAVYLNICHFADEKGQCWPSRKRLATLVNVTTRTIDRVNNELLEKGFMAKFQVFDPNGSSKSNIYQLLIIEENDNSQNEDKQNPKAGNLPKGEDIFSQGGDTKDTGGETYCHPGGDSNDTVIITSDQYPINNLFVEPSSDEKKETEKGSPPKEREKRFPERSPQFQISRFLFEKIRKNNPKHKEPNITSWAKSIDLMLRIDKRTPEEIKEVIVWCQTDSFWQSNILSTKKLREKFDQLKMKMNGGGNGKNINGISRGSTSRQKYASDVVEKANEAYKTIGIN